MSQKILHRLATNLSKIKSNMISHVISNINSSCLDDVKALIDIIWSKSITLMKSCNECIHWGHNCDWSDFSIEMHYNETQDWTKLCGKVNYCYNFSGWFQWNKVSFEAQILLYTLSTLKYGVNLLNAPVSSVLHQNSCVILTAAGSL